MRVTSCLSSSHSTRLYRAEPAARESIRARFPLDFASPRRDAAWVGRATIALPSVLGHNRDFAVR
jgi:hypothetical protein